MSNIIEHQLHIRNSTGELLTVLQDGAFVALSYGLRDSEPGVLEFTLPGDFDAGLLMIDGQVEVWRAVGSGQLQLEGDTVWFIRRIRFATGEGGVTTISCTCYSAISLLGRRIAAYYAGTSYTDKVLIPWDNMMREIVDENFGPGASDAVRNISNWLSIQPDMYWGASYTKSFPWRNILNTLQEIIADVRGQGIYCTFDVVRVGDSLFEFRVFLGPRGSDHTWDTSSPVIVSQDRRNLLAPSLDFDWEAEKNFIYGTGQGQGTDRVLKTAFDTIRLGISPFNRHELNQDARQAEIENSVQAEANSALQGNRPIRTFTGMISQTDGCLYGIHWAWGDIVTAEYQGLTIDCHVDAVTVSIDQSGTEIVQGNLRSVSDV